MNDEEGMALAIEEAKKARQEGEIPVGAVIVKGDKVIACGHNQREGKHDIGSHAEIEAIREAEQVLKNWRLDGCTLYVTLEPCLMCAGAILQSRISKLVFGAKDDKDGAIVSRYFVFDAPSIHERPLVFPGVKEKECQQFLQDFFQEKRRM